MNLFKQHSVLTAIAVILVLLTSIIWIAQSNEQILLLEPDEIRTESEQAQEEARLIYEADLLADYNLPDRHLSYSQASSQPAPTTSAISPAPTTSSTSLAPTPSATSQTEQSLATEQELKLSDIRPSRTIVEKDDAGNPQENRPLDSFSADESTVYIKAFKANVRSLPRTDADLVTKLEMGDKLLRTGYGNYWSAVTTSAGKKGYILTDLISQERIYKLAPTPSPTPKPKPTATTKATGSKKTKATTAQPTPAPKASESTQPAPEPQPAKPSDEAKPTPTAAPQKQEHSDEFMLFARVIAMEGNGQYDSYLAVASVIMNHVSHKNFPNTITGVLSRKNAFTVYKKAAAGQPAKVNSTAMRAAYDAYYNGARNLPSYVVAFCTPTAYERSVARKGTFSKMAVHQRAYNAVWCYYPADKP